MQRVLSMQTARGFGESSEFVTKRSCISFLFSIGFLCLLGGFMLGRFATHRTIIIRAEKTRLQFANNGLEFTEHLQQRVIDILEDPSLVGNFTENTYNTKEIFSELKFVNQIFEYDSCTVAKVLGTRESDRYVIISVSEKGAQIVNELLKSINKVHEEQEWNPRRTIYFCVCESFSKNCYDELPDYVQSKVVAFLTIPERTQQGSYNLLSAEEKCLLVSGSNIAKTAVQQASDSMRHFNSKSLNLCNETKFIFGPRLDFDVPHAVLSFVNDKNSSLATGYDSLIVEKKILAQIIGLSVWRLSESIILPWDPKNLKETISQTMFRIESSRDLRSPERRQMIDDLNNLMEKVTKHDEKLQSMELNNSLNVRIGNDLLLDLDKTILCLDDQQHNSSSRIRECYKNVAGILQA